MAHSHLLILERYLNSYIGIESKTPLLAFKSRNESQVEDMIQYLKLHYQICDSWLMTPSLAGF